MPQLAKRFLDNDAGQDSGTTDIEPFQLMLDLFQIATA